MCHLVLALPFLALSVFWLLPEGEAFALYVMALALTGAVYWLAIRAMRAPVVVGIGTLLHATERSTTMMNGFGGAMGFGGIGMLIFWALVIGGIVVLVRWLSAKSSAENVPSGRQGSPLDILRERYARGEIDKDEFEQKRRDVGAG
jgi:putative membrane protein